MRKNRRHRKPATGSSPAKRIAVLCSWLALGGALGAVSVLVICYMMWTPSLPSITRISDYRMAQATTIYARDNSVIGYFSKERRFPLSLDNMSPYLPLAFVAIEDVRFYEHEGVDYRGILRAVIRNAQAGREREGGSTITQQLIKILLLTPERTYERKFKEAVLAYRLERYLSKDEILYLYLNLIDLGSRSFGVEAASRTYFGKHAKDLTLAEAALLAGLPKAPSMYNPYSSEKLALGRQKDVLHAMLRCGFIDQAAHDAALEQKLEFRRMPDPSWKTGAWYLEEVRRRLLDFFAEDNIRALGLPIDLYGEEALYTGGFHIYTAMDPEHQQAAETALRQGLYEADRRHGWRGPLDKLPQEKWEEFLTETAFAPEALDAGGWAKALVVGVAKEKAELRLGDYTGTIAVGNMGWCRTPNLRVSAAAAAKVQDASKVLQPGDVVFVSAVGAVSGSNPVGAPASAAGARRPVPTYDPAAVRQDTPIALSLEQTPAIEGAVVSIETESGDVVALAGGYKYSQANQFNRATQARRQPGSSFKPVVYSAALDQGYTPGTVLNDTPFVLPDRYTGKVWTPGNSDGKFLGEIPLSRALAASRNVCTVRVAQQIGMPSVINRAKDLGIPGDIPAFLPVSLGSYEATPMAMTIAYTAFANNGKRVEPRFITAVHNSWHEPLVAFEPNAVPAVSPQNAFIMNRLLKGVVDAGTGSAAKAVGKPLAGKTGTSNNERDAWFIGYTPHLVTGVYVGYDDNSPMGRSEYGGKAALPVFVQYRQAVEARYPADDFPEPEGIVWLGGAPGTTGSYPCIEGIPPREHVAGADADADAGVSVFMDW